MLNMPLPDAVELSRAGCGLRRKDGSFRVANDGTHGVAVNACIKLRGQIACPTAGMSAR